MTLPDDKRQTLNEIIEDIINDKEYIENADRETRLATERIVAGLRQHMVNSCREILDYELGEKPSKRKEAITLCMDKGFINSRKEYTEVFSFGEKTAKVYGRDVEDEKLYRGLIGLPEAYRKFSRDVLDYIESSS